MSRYECCICHRPLDPERHVRSQHSGERYCPPDEWEVCSVHALGVFMERQLKQKQGREHPKEAA